LDPYSKFAGLTWIQNLLRKFPNHTDTNPPPLQIPVDNEGVVKDVHRTINAQTPTYDLLSPDHDILQAIRTILNDLPIRTDIAHVHGHQDRHKLWHELDIREKINVLADRQADDIYAIMASPSKNYLTGDASRSQSTPTTCSPPNDAFRLLTIIVSMDDDALPASSYGRTPPTC
jgi:hypothetical protein